MTRKVFPAGMVLFAGCHPEHIEQAKEYATKNGYTKEDVRIYKHTHKTPYSGNDPAFKGKVFESHSVYVETRRPIVVDCGILLEVAHNGDRGE